MDIVVFDSDCGFCTASVSFLRRRVRPQVRFVPWQDADLPSLGLTAEACAQALQFVHAESGAVSSGSRAVAATLRTAPVPWPLAGTLIDLPGIAPVAARAYRWVAANRYRLPGSTPACSVAQHQAR